MRNSTKKKALAAISPGTASAGAMTDDRSIVVDRYYGDQIREGSISRDEAYRRVNRYLWIGAGLTLAFTGFAGYHGYKRSGGDWGAAVGWGFFGAIGGPITAAVALAQGYGKRG